MGDLDLRAWRILPLMLTMQERRLSPGSEEASYPKTSGWIPAHAVITITVGFVALLLAGVRGIAFASPLAKATMHWPRSG